MKMVNFNWCVFCNYRGDYDTLLERFRQEKMTSDTWMMKWKQYESYKDLADELQSRARNAEEKVKTFQM